MAMYLGDQKVRITDKSKTNLLDVFNRTEGTLIGDQAASINTTLRPDLLDETKYFVGLSSNNYFKPGHIKNSDFFIFKYAITATCSHDSYGIAFPVRCKPNTNYVLSATLTTGQENTQYMLSIGFYKEDGTWLSHGLNRNGNNYVYRTSPADAAYLIAVLAPGKDVIPAIFTNITLVEDTFTGTTYEGYEPYNNELQPPMIKANNLIPNDYFKDAPPKTNNGMVYTSLGDGSIQVTGEKIDVTKNTDYRLTQNFAYNHLVPGIYYYITTNSPSKFIVARVGIRKPDGTNRYVAGKFKLEPGEQLYYIYLNCAANTAGGHTFNEIVYPMLNEGSVPLPFRPYSEEPEYLY